MLGFDRITFDPDLLGVGVLGDDLRRRHAVGDEVHDQGHRDPHAADACPATQAVGVNGDPVEFGHRGPPVQSMRGAIRRTNCGGASDAPGWIALRCGIRIRNVAGKWLKG